jgi:beta-galactosidase/beta-glucuronidase
MVSRYPFITIPFKKFEYWSPENPYLYNMVIFAGNDKVESYFAMRKVEIKKDEEDIPRIFLNNKPYFQNGLLDQGYWPDGLYTAPSDEALIFDIQKAKELGFNMLRKHIKIEPLRWYYHCDRLGMLVWQDMINGGEDYNTLLVGYLPTLFPGIVNHIKDSHYKWFGRKSEEGRKEWSEECRETVELLYNSPSIVVWVPFNEAWGQFDAKKAYDLIRELDTTRLVDHASGWYDQKCGDFKSIHEYFHPLKVKVETRPVILSEFGGYACYINEHSYSLQIYGYRIYLTKEDFHKAYQDLLEKEIENLRKLGLSAAVYTQLSDVEDEVNGLFTYDRKICKVFGTSK